MGDFRKPLAHVTETIAILFFIFAIFLLDVNANVIAMSGNQVLVPVFNDIVVKATSMFWLGLIVATISFFIFAIRSMYKRHVKKARDIFFVVLGVLGWGIIFAGGVLIMAGCGNFVMPFFDYSIPRVSFYHFGLGLTIVTVIYFALTR